MRSLTSFPTKRISGPRKFRSSPQKDFCNSICQQQTNAPKHLAQGLNSQTSLKLPRPSVSGRSLLKTGIFEILAGDYWQFRARIGQMRSPETSCQFVKARCRRAFLGLLRAKSPGARLAGWRRSGIRTSLPANSLLTGNFTGNSVVSGLRKRISQQKTFAPQRHLDQFPTQINREDFSKNRDFSKPEQGKAARR